MAHCVVPESGGGREESTEIEKTMSTCKGEIEIYWVSPRTADEPH